MNMFPATYTLGAGGATSPVSVCVMCHVSGAEVGCPLGPLRQTPAPGQCCTTTPPLISTTSLMSGKPMFYLELAE